MSYVLLMNIKVWNLGNNFRFFSELVINFASDKGKIVINL